MSNVVQEIHEQIIKKLRASHEHGLNKSGISCEQIMNKLYYQDPEPRVLHLLPLFSELWVYIEYLLYYRNLHIND